LIIAIDTSTLTMSLAVLDGERVVHDVALGPPKRLSTVLPAAITELVPLKDITGFVVGIGPGSFTGLRISLSCVKGLAYGLRVPVTGVSSLAAVAAAGPRGVELFSSAVVKKGELYLRRGEAESALTVAAFAQAMKDAPAAVALGPGIVEYKAQLMALGIEGERLLETVKFPSAVQLARLATMPAAFDAQALFALEPHYIRSSGAEDNPKFPPLPGVPAQARLKEDH
jgi:tRNA threonylcarbamoyladenosine biosynthesis protein TsaB